MKLSEYIKSKRTRSVSADIIERWTVRVEGLGLHNQGALGAERYIEGYAKTAASKKLLGFAQYAWDKGLKDFAVVFYLRAAQLDGVELEIDVEVSGVGDPMPKAQVLEENEIISFFPENMQPGRLVTMQPVDAPHSREEYILHPGFWGQPKIDGNKLLVFATPLNVYYQARSLRLKPAFDRRAHEQFQKLADQAGSFILEGELTYLDVKGGEHRTSAQAITANADLAQPEAAPIACYVVFSCLYKEGQVFKNYGSMVDFGFRVAQKLDTPVVRAIGTSRITEAKMALCEDQYEEGREGEIWFNPTITYTPGKSNDGQFVRTKYTQETVVRVTGLTETTAPGHAFGAIEIESLDGKPLGSVGTGCNMEDKRELKHLFGQGELRILIRHQGVTEKGIPWHARYLEVVK
jgi:bifunctional non-homologous end joining protein LigD